MVKKMKLNEFFALHPVFTRDEFIAFLNAQGSHNLNTQRELLAYHRNNKQIIPLHQGLYAVIPTGTDPDNYQVDPYLIASHITQDAVLAYHSALDFHGVSYSVFFKFTYLSSKAVRPFQFQSNHFNRLSFPKNLIRKQKTDWGVMIGERLGQDIKVTKPERTLVDVLDRPKESGGWEEVWRSLESISALNIDECLEYAFFLDNSTTIAKLGFFLEQHQENFNVKEEQLIRLEKNIPSGYHYLNRHKRESGKFIKRWHLVVPEYIINRGWEEPYVDI
jgi:predicted transcriptional regulator of viral defense system